MTLTTRARRLSAAAATAALMAFSVPVFAQDITESHLKAAREAIAATHATDIYDVILPQAADALKSQLIQKNPDLVELISKTIDEKALELAGRRADLEKEAAMAYAKVFTEEELKAITVFYGTPAGLKVLSDGPRVTSEVGKAANIWQNGLARDLAQNVGDALKLASPAPIDGGAPAPDGATPPADGAAPAPANPN